jgi:hypothetical protein
MSYAPLTCARHAILITLFAAASVLAQGGGVPQAPLNLKEAEAQGLQRLSVEELKAFMPGVNQTWGTTGKSTRFFNPDGSYERKALKTFTGKWSLDESKNAYCLDVYKAKGMDKNCFAVFRAAEGNFYFDYDLGDGFYSHTWSPAKSK